jgi:uroporphyrinogen-III decarboxylase
MTSRDRVLAALAHEQPDRVPIVIGTSNTTGIEMGAYRRLKAGLGIESPDRFIDVGVDILNPVQTSAGRMSNLAELKRRYGSRLTFCGAIDTHLILPTGPPDEVRREVHRVLDIMAPGGGYMVASVHTIVDDLPPGTSSRWRRPSTSTGRASGRRRGRSRRRRGSPTAG